MTVVDLFSGARGWEALSGVDAVGIEIDPWACATSSAAGFLTVRQDVTTVDPGRFYGYDGLIASAPCQDWSEANKGPKRPERKALVWLPLEWIKAIRPRWIALEQVPAVLPVWHQYQAWLTKSGGYSVWCGILSAERYGVPQVRRRAVLIASVDRRVTPPAPTHRGFDTYRQQHEPDDLFGLPRAINAFNEPTTIDRRQNGAPVIHDARPAPTVTAAAGGKSVWTVRPARTVCGDRSPRWVYDDADGNRGVSGDWLLERPSTTVTGDPRVAVPGHHDGPQMDDAARLSVSDAARLSVSDAARLQSFPADWPWQGNLSAKHSQIGNAIPPLLAAAILGQVA